MQPNFANLTLSFMQTCMALERNPTGPVTMRDFQQALEMEREGRFGDAHVRSPDRVGPIATQGSRIGFIAGRTSEIPKRTVDAVGCSGTISQGVPGASNAFQRLAFSANAIRMAKRRETPSIQSLDRGLILLEAVGRSAHPVPLADLTTVLAIDPSSIYRLANTLKRRGFLAQVSGGYVLGASAWRLANAFHWSTSLRELAREHLTALAHQVGESSHLSIRVGRQSLSVHDELTNRPVVVALRPGRSEPLHSTAMGKALLTDFDLAQLQALLGDEPLPAFTPRTICSLPALAEECRHTRQRGFAVDDQEMFEGVRCVAAPLRDANGEVVAAISITAPVDRLSLRDRFRVGRQVLLVARQLSVKLGHSESQDVPSQA